MIEPTNRQLEILAWIVAYRAEHFGRSPTVREIVAGIGLRSPAAIRFHLEALEAKGFISRVPKQARSIVVLKEAPDA